MIQARQAKNNQIILLITMGVFLMGVALNYYAPSPDHLRLQINRVRQEVQSVRRINAASNPTTPVTACPTDPTCQSQLLSLQRKNWILQNDGILARINEIKSQISLCRNQQSQASASDYECTRKIGLMNAQNEEEVSNLERELRGFEERLRTIQTEYDRLQAEEQAEEKTQGDGMTQRERELLEELDRRLGRV